MAHVVLFHHAQGLTPGVVAFADRLRTAGHTVDTPDLYEGRTFDDLGQGVAHAQQLGFGAVIERGVAAAGAVLGPSVFAGMSLGVLPAQRLAQTDERAVGAVLLHGTVQHTEFGERWPDGVPAHIHAAEDDEWFAEDRPAAEVLVAAGAAELFTYPGDAHLFTDASLSVFDQAATDLVVERVRRLLDEMTS